MLLIIFSVITCKYIVLVYCSKIVWRWGVLTPLFYYYCFVVTGNQQIQLDALYRGSKNRVENIQRYTNIRNNAQGQNKNKTTVVDTRNPRTNERKKESENNRPKEISIVSIIRQ